MKVRHKLIQHQQQRRPPPYALQKEIDDTVNKKSKNKDINSFQHDVHNFYKLPSVMKKLEYVSKQDKKLHRSLERNLEDPNNTWKPRDHSTKFMHNLRKYSVIERNQFQSGYGSRSDKQMNYPRASVEITQ
mmetsp:Transcript_31767/g.48750  ORF Transcript_31767/g.48750 Transcript_31767/m.48750 type:complete len:131 (+) Transcript_31767:2743-3135(+)